VREVHGRFKPVLHAVYVSYVEPGKLLLRDAMKASDVYSVHLADRRVIADAERADAAGFAEVVVILRGVEYIPRKQVFAGQEPETIRLGNGGPEARPPANGTIAAVSALRQVEVCFERHRSAMTAARVSLQHVDAPANAGVDRQDRLNMLVDARVRRPVPHIA